MSLFKAIRASGSVDADQIRKELLRLSFEGVTGPIQYKVNGDLVSTKYVIFIVKDGKFVQFRNLKTG